MIDRPHLVRLPRPRSNWLRIVLGLFALAGSPASGADAESAPASSGAPAVVAPRVMIITMFEPEARVWLDRLGPWQDVPVAGLSPDDPAVHCNGDAVCVLTTGMGHANAAASTMALVLSNAFDLAHTYFLVAGIEGIALGYTFDIMLGGAKSTPLGI